MRSIIFADDGSPLRASCEITRNGAAWDVIIESRGGTIGKPSERNPDYSAGLEALVDRLCRARATLLDATVESENLIKQGLSLDDRRIVDEAITYPLSLNPGAAPELLRALRRGQRDVGSQRQEGGGNSTRRVRLHATGLETLPDERSVPDYLTNAYSLGVVPREEQEAAARQVEAQGDFDPSSVTDARERILAAIARRQGQPTFRRHLLRAYEVRCAVTGCDVEAALEAAHIVPYRGAATNHVQNGLLLRSDVHSLFDQGLLAIHPETLRVHLAPALRASTYAALHGVTLRVPAATADRPSKDAMEKNWQASVAAKVQD